MKKLLTIIIAFLALFSIAQADFEPVGWQKMSTYLETQCDGGCDVLINGTSRYLNFGATSGSSGYGVRDNGGTMQFKNSAGAWANIASGAGSQTPWGQAIDGAGYALSNAGVITATNFIATSTTATSSFRELSFTNATGTNLVMSGSSTFPWLNSASSSFGTLAIPSITNALLWTNGNGAVNSTTTGLVSAGTGISVTASRYVIGGALTITNDGVTSISASAPLVNNLSTGAISLTCPTCSTFTYPFPLGATSTPLSFTGKLTITSASTTNLSVSNHMVYARWSDRMSMPEATSTDEGFKFGSCLESGGHSVTIDKIDSHIASTSATTAGQGITWNFYIAALAGSSTPMKLLTASSTTVGTTTINTLTSGFSTATIPAGYCYWWVPNNASTSQIKMLHINLYGYEN